ncbi:MAG TPA: methyltransferase domain-containing protein [Gemmatimonadaceae bacterium]|nr:methyltransferase domain-containing protein [Gemmatimonadaceae bacterium]
MPIGSQSRRKPGPRRAVGEWWTTYFDDHYLHEFEPLFDLERDRREVARLIDLMGLPSGARLLDVPCGQGRHAHLFAEAGFNVDGLDYSGNLLAVAKRRGTSKTLRYTRGDMRRLPARWTGRFDAVVNLFTSFGFFTNPADDRRVLGEFARVLRPGGVLVWHGGDRDGVMARFLERDWWVTSDGTVFAQERAFDAISGMLTIATTWRGSSARGAREHRIRLYTPTRLAELCAEAGLVVEQAFDGFTPRPVGRRSSQMLLVARKDLAPRRSTRPRRS